MERSRLELLLEQELLQNAQQARILCGSPVTRFVRSVQTAGGVAAVRESCRRNRPSDAFDSLVQAGRLDLSAEASAVKGKYGPLFTDEEVNTCLTLLLESGYFQKRGGNHRPARVFNQFRFSSAFFTTGASRQASAPPIRAVTSCGQVKAAVTAASFAAGTTVGATSFTSTRYSASPFAAAANAMQPHAVRCCAVRNLPTSSANSTA